MKNSWEKATSTKDSRTSPYCRSMKRKGEKKLEGPLPHPRKLDMDTIDKDKWRTAIPSGKEIGTGRG